VSQPTLPDRVGQVSDPAFVGPLDERRNGEALVPRTAAIPASALEVREDGAREATPPAPKRRWRYFGWTAASALLGLMALTVGLWAHYQSQHVVSRNAMVRGHLTQIGTRLSGVLASVDVAEGASVARGHVLGRLDDRHLRSEAQEAQAEIDGLQREVEVERLAIEQQQRVLQSKSREASANLAAARAEIAAAQSRVRDADEFHQARVALFERSMVSREEVRKADTKLAEAQAQLNVARANTAAVQSADDTARLESQGIWVRQQRIDVLKANVARARARLDRANADLEGTLIRAPQDGAVMRWLIKPGGSIDVGQPVVSMSIGKDHWVEAWIDEDDIGRVNVGSEAIVTLPSHPNREFPGVVETIGLTTDFEMPPPDMPQPRSLRMRGAPVVGVLVRLREAPKVMLPGLSAVVAVRTAAQ
jgi:multidrug resistance efflux pump